MGSIRIYEQDISVDLLCQRGRKVRSDRADALATVATYDCKHTRFFCGAVTYTKENFHSQHD